MVNNHHHKEGERVRTTWTPEMDKYFIELLLQQVNKGNNRFDHHLFSKKAWKLMTSLFNLRFKSWFEKEILKNRHKTLRCVYKAVKKILEHEGFSWDNERKMIVGDNSVWDDYLKKHPEARAYRIKTIPYFNDLCLIYGDGKIEDDDDNNNKCGNGIESNVISPPDSVTDGALESLQEIRDIEDYSSPMTNGGGDDSVLEGVALAGDVQKASANVIGTASALTNRTRTYWQPPMDRYFIDLMLEQLEKGNQIDGVFRKQAWMEMITSFNAAFGFNYDVDVLKNRYKTLRRQYNVINNLLQLDGFGWDDARQMVTADDYVWQDYIKTHTDARQFMTRPVPYYKDLCVICNDENIDDSISLSDPYLEMHKNAQQVKFNGGYQSSRSPAGSVSCEDEVGDVWEQVHTDLKPTEANQKNKRQLEKQPNTSLSKRSRTREEATAAGPWQIATAISHDERKGQISNSISIESVIEAIQALPDMDEDLILDACDLLEDETKAKTFMALNVKLRKKWLLRKLR